MARREKRKRNQMPEEVDPRPRDRWGQFVSKPIARDPDPGEDEDEDEDEFEEDDDYDDFEDEEDEAA